MKRIFERLKRWWFGQQVLIDDGAMLLIGKLEGEAPMMHMRRTVELVRGDDDKAVFLAAVGKDPLLLVRRACDFQAGRPLEPLE